MQAQLDRTAEAVKRQLQAMGCRLFDVGLRSEVKDGMLNREAWTAEQVVKAIPWLKRQNAQGEDIYIRPAREAPSALVLIDDLTEADARRGLAARGFEPALVVQTSQSARGWQAWVRLSGDQAQPPNVRTQVAKLLAEQVGGDPNSADFAHYGRLAGFTNRKPERAVAGRAPFVLLDRCAPSAVASRGPELVRAGLARLSQAKAVALRDEVRKHAEELPPAPPQPAYRLREAAAWFARTIAHLRKAFGPDFDESRGDWMAAGALYASRYDFPAVVGAMQQHAAGLIDRKGKTAADYIELTATKAEIWHELMSKGARWEDVKDGLIGLANARIQARAAQAAREASERPQDAPKQRGPGMAPG